MAVEDAGGRAFKYASFGLDIRLAAFSFFWRDVADGNADRFGELVDFLEFVHLLLVLRDDPFPAIHIGNGIFFTEVI